MESGGVAVVHPDILTVGGAMELKKLGGLCEEYGAAMAIHMAESPVACMAAVHAAAAVPQLLGAGIPFCGYSLVGGSGERAGTAFDTQRFYRGARPAGLGIEALNEELIAAHLHTEYPGLWEPTDAGTGNGPTIGNGAENETEGLDKAAFYYGMSGIKSALIRIFPMRCGESPGGAAAPRAYATG